MFNVAYGEATTLNVLHLLIGSEAKSIDPNLAVSDPVYADFRNGDIRHSLADISRISSLLEYAPTHSVRDGIKETVRWFMRDSPTKPG